MGIPICGQNIYSSVSWRHIQKKLLLPPPQVNPVDLISRDNKIHVGDWFHTDGTGMDRVSTYFKGKFRYLGDQDSRGILEGGEGSD